MDLDYTTKRAISLIHDHTPWAQIPQSPGDLVQVILMYHPHPIHSVPDVHLLHGGEIHQRV